VSGVKSTETLWSDEDRRWRNFLVADDTVGIALRFLSRYFLGKATH